MLALAKQYAVKAGRTLRNRGKEKTRRTRGVSKLAQAYQAMWSATPFTCSATPAQEVVLAVGSSYNATGVRGPDSGFDVVVNCCMESRPVWDAGTVWLPLEDSNDCDLATVQEEFDRAVETIRDKAEEKHPTPLKVLVHCFWGCSRSVAVAILLAARFTGNNDYDAWLKLIQGQRPYIDVSENLARQVKFTLGLWRQTAELARSAEAATAARQQGSSQSTHAPSAGVGGQ